MRPPLRAVIICCLIYGVCASGKVLACSVSHVATAAEISDFADVILFVKVPEEIITEESPIEMQVVEVVKGDFKAKTVTVQGETVGYDGPNNGTPPYNFVRPGGRHGDCYASDYKAGGQFLLFLISSKVHWAPLAATNEEVSGLKDPWVVWVKERLAWRSAAFCSPIFDAAKTGDLEKVKALLKDNPKRVSIKDNYGDTPLHDAVENGRKEVAELLLLNKADVNAVRIRGDTPLHLAAEKGHQDMVELLLAKGANVNAKTKNGMTPLHVAASHQFNDVAELLRRHGGRE